MPFTRLRSRRRSHSNSWIASYMKNPDENLKANAIDILGKCRIFNAQSVFCEVSDGSIFMKAELTTDALDVYLNSNPDVSSTSFQLDNSKLLLLDYSIDLRYDKKFFNSELVMKIKKFKLWGLQESFSRKTNIIYCMCNADVLEAAKAMWLKGKKEKEKKVTICPEPADMCSVPLTQLLEEMMEVDDSDGVDDSTSDAGPRTALDRLRAPFTSEELVIPPDQQSILDSIQEWKPGYVPPTEVNQSASSCSDAEEILLEFGHTLKADQERHVRRNNFFNKHESDDKQNDSQERVTADDRNSVIADNNCDEGMNNMETNVPVQDIRNEESFTVIQDKTATRVLSPDKYQVSVKGNVGELCNNNTKHIIEDNDNSSNSCNTCGDHASAEKHTDDDVDERGKNHCEMEDNSPIATSTQVQCGREMHPELRDMNNLSPVHAIPSQKRVLDSDSQTDSDSFDMENAQRNSIDEISGEIASSRDSQSDPPHMSKRKRESSPMILETQPFIPQFDDVEGSCSFKEQKCSNELDTTATTLTRAGWSDSLDHIPDAQDCRGESSGSLFSSGESRKNTSASDSGMLNNGVITSPMVGLESSHRKAGDKKLKILSRNKKEAQDTPSACQEKCVSPDKSMEAKNSTQRKKAEELLAELGVQPETFKTTAPGQFRFSEELWKDVEEYFSADSF